MLKITKQTIWQQYLDWFLRPLMRALAGRAWREEPQRSHRWNCHILKSLPEKCVPWCVVVDGDSAASRRWLWGVVPLFHIPIMGGWRKYVVLEPQAYAGEWHPGWSTGKEAGCSRVAVVGAVRLLRSFESTSFFGVEAGSGAPLLLKIKGFGTIGDGGPFSQLPLL